MVKILLERLKKLCVLYQVDRRSKRNLFKGLNSLFPKRYVFEIDDIARDYVIFVLERKLQHYQRDKLDGFSCWLKCTIPAAYELEIRLQEGRYPDGELQLVEFV